VHTCHHVFFKKLLSWEISLQFHGYAEMGSCLSRSKGTHTRKRRKLVLDKPSQSFLSSSVVLGFRGYASFAGWEIIGIILVSTALMQASRNGGDLWLSFWVDTLTSSTSPHLVSYYLRGMLVLAVANSLFTMARAFSFAYGGLRAAFYVHKMLLHKVVAAPITFFDRNPRGRILNRFSSDQYSIDDSLPFIANILLANVFMLSGIAIVLCYVQVKHPYSNDRPPFTFHI
jgi:ABC-type multidrug transport system fused ATPase/permease subunit